MKKRLDLGSFNLEKVMVVEEEGEYKLLFEFVEKNMFILHALEISCSRNNYNIRDHLSIILDEELLQ